MEKQTLYQRRRAAGKCGYCGKKPSPGKATCKSCRNTKCLDNWYRQQDIAADPEKHRRRLARQALARRKRKWHTLVVYGGRCACCGETNFEFLQIDHIESDGAEFRNGLGKLKSGNSIYRWLKANEYPEGFQVLCANCNFAKGMYGYCPHSRSKEGVSTATPTSLING